MYSEQRLQRQPDLSRALASRNEAVTACVFGRDQPDKARARTLSARVTGTKSSDARRLPGRRRSRHAPLAHIAPAAVPSPNAERCRSTSENIRRAPAASSFERSLEQRASAVMLLCRRIVLAAIRRELDRSNRNDEQLVAAFVAVAELKKVNDSEAHAAGDELLRHVAPIDQWEWT
jgi:GGDEF domain-containing protein